MEKDEQLSSARKASKVRRDRRRVERACDTCRRRKERCNGARPVCSNCQNASRNCTYLAEVKRRGLPEGWVRGMEKFWSIAMLQHPELETDVLLAVSKALAAPHDSVLSRMWTDDVHDQGLLGRWRNSRLAQELEDCLSQLDNLPQQRLADIESSADIRLQVANDATPDGSCVTQQNKRADPDPQSRPICIAPAPTDAAMFHKILPVDTNDRINLYFSHTQVSFPILQKHEVLRTYHTWSSGHATTTQGDRACLLAIMDHEASADTQPQQPLQPCDPGSEADAQFQSFLDPILIQLFPHRKAYEVSQAQTMLILTLTKLSHSDPQGAWLCAGATLRIALLLRKQLFEISSASGPTSTHQFDRLQRVISGGFVLDGLLSVWCQTSPQFKTNELHLISRIEEDGIDEWNPLLQSFSADSNSNASPARSNSAFNRVVQVTKFYVIAHAQLASSADTVAQKAACLREMSAWESSLSKSHRWRFALQDTRTGIPPHCLTFHLLYLATLFKLHLTMILFKSDESLHELSIVHEAFVQFLYRHACDLRLNSIPSIWPLILGSHLQSLSDLCGINHNFAFAAGLPANLTMLSYVIQQWPCQNQLNKSIEQLRSILTPDLTISVPENMTDRTYGGPAVAQPEENLMYNIDPVEAAPTIQPPEQSNFSSTLTPPEQSTSAFDASDVDITEFMTMDAMIWDEPWKQSFQHLGFTDAENTESGLQEFFSNM